MTDKNRLRHSLFLCVKFRSQPSSERGAFSRRQLDALLTLAEKGIGELLEIQRAAVESLAAGC